MFDQPQRRHNVLTGEWVSVSPHRTQRPWQGRVEAVPQAARPQYDPECYLCPGNSRAAGSINPRYPSTFAFANDFPAFLPDRLDRPDRPDRHAEQSEDTLLRGQPLAGTCRVLCFSPRHDLTLAQMPAEQIRLVVDLWAGEIQELGRKWRWVQIFENKGELMGCSNPHPHGQVWAGDFLPNEPAKELRQQKLYYEKHHAPLLRDYAALETERGERIVAQNTHWLAVVPWWAVWPFETLILPKRQVLRLPELLDEERDDLAALLKTLLSGYDRLFDTSFPYSMGWHGAPTDEGDYAGWQLHAHIYPPLLRSATVKKFMVGYEMLGEPQRDITAEQAAERLRAAIGESRPAPG